MNTTVFIRSVYRIAVSAAMRGGPRATVARHTPCAVR